MPITVLSPHVSPAGERIVPDPRLKQAAREFEAAMMKELVAPMSQPSALFENGGADEMGVMGEYAAESLARGLSSRGGIGIADRIVHAFSRSGTSPESVTGLESCRSKTTSTRTNH